MPATMLGRAPLFDNAASPAAYRLTTPGGDVRGLVDAVVTLDVLGFGRGLPVLLPASTAEVARLASAPHADRLWVEPVEADLDAAAIATWTDVGRHLGGIVVRDLHSTPGHGALVEHAIAGRVHAEALSVEEIRARRQSLQGLRSVATGVHTNELHRACRTVGIDLVGGRYLDDVHLQTTTAAAGDRLILLELSSALESEQPSLAEVSSLIERSPTLSFEVLRLINSAFVGLRHRVDDLRRAVGLLGPGRITQVVSLLLARDFTDRPTELFRTALTRAKMAEEVAASLGQPRQMYYITGLFSMLEPLLERPLADVLDQLPLTDEVCNALLHHDGRLGRVLQAVKLY